MSGSKDKKMSGKRPASSPDISCAKFDQKCAKTEDEKSANSLEHEKREEFVDEESGASGEQNSG